MKSYSTLILIVIAQILVLASLVFGAQFWLNRQQDRLKAKLLLSNIFIGTFIFFAFIWYLGGFVYPKIIPVFSIDSFAPFFLPIVFGFIIRSRIRNSIHKKAGRTRRCS
jgi:hypothetical protein